MSIIAPTITVETPEEYQASVDMLHPFAKRVHVDISDGVFSPRFLLSEQQIWWPQEWEVDIHAMVVNPADYVDTLIALKPRMISFHVEATEGDLLSIIKKVQAAGIKAGVALLKPTVPETVRPYLEAADHVMVFSGTLGYQGGRASLMQLEKVRLIKAINPRAEIGWDGGVNTENAYTLAQGGVDVLNVGGGISKASNPADAYAKLVVEINKHGVI